MVDVETLAGEGGAGGSRRMGGGRGAGRREGSGSRRPAAGPSAYQAQQEESRRRCCSLSEPSYSAAPRRWSSRAAVRRSAHSALAGERRGCIPRAQRRTSCSFSWASVGSCSASVRRDCRSFRGTVSLPTYLHNRDVSASCPPSICPRYRVKLCSPTHRSVRLF